MEAGWSVVVFVLVLVVTDSAEYSTITRFSVKNLLTDFRWAR